MQNRWQAVMYRTDVLQKHNCLERISKSHSKYIFFSLLWKSRTGRIVEYIESFFKNARLTGFIKCDLGSVECQSLKWKKNISINSTDCYLQNKLSRIYSHNPKKQMSIWVFNWHCWLVDDQVRWDLSSDSNWRWKQWQTRAVRI